jgi:hypothetical protein
MNYAPPKYVGPSYADALPEALARARREPVVVACVYWGDKYPVAYVRKLRDSVRKHLTIPHEFVCVTSDPRVEALGIKCLSPLLPYEGWWQKVGYFVPNMFEQYVGPVLALDIDVVVTGNLDRAFNLQVPQHGLVMIENFGPNKPHCAHNSSAMLFIAGDCNDIAEEFKPEYMQHLHGDQCYIWRKKDGRIDNFPKGLFRSYKYECMAAPPPPSTAVVVFHGEPNPHQVKARWIHEHWHSI